MSIGTFKQDILKQEIEIVQDKINHFDNLRHRTKQMGLTLWLAAFGFGISQDAEWIMFIAIFIPIPFWYLESIYHANQEGFIARFWALREFIRNGKFKVQGKEPPVKLKDCFEHESFGEFPVPDYFPNATFSKTELKKRVGVFHNFFKPKMVVFYLPPILIALLTRLFKYGL